jgi:hypothetical protein
MLNSLCHPLVLAIVISLSSEMEVLLCNCSPSKGVIILMDLVSFPSQWDFE